MRPRKFVRSTALVLVLTAALTVTAFAADPTQQPATKTDNKSSYYPTSVEMTEDDAGNPMIRKTYQLSVSDDPQKLPVADFERDGRRYYLLDMTKEDKIGVDTKEHSETVKLSSDTKEMEQILQRLDAQKEVTTEDGHTGVLTLAAKAKAVYGKDGFNICFLFVQVVVLNLVENLLSTRLGCTCGELNHCHKHPLILFGEEGGR